MVELAPDRWAAIDLALALDHLQPNVLASERSGMHELTRRLLARTTGMGEAGPAGTRDWVGIGLAAHTLAATKLHVRHVRRVDLCRFIHQAPTDGHVVVLELAGEVNDLLPGLRQAAFEAGLCIAYSAHDHDTSVGSLLRWFPSLPDEVFELRRRKDGAVVGWQVWQVATRDLRVRGRAVLRRSPEAIPIWNRRVRGGCPSCSWDTQRPCECSAAFSSPTPAVAAWARCPHLVVAEVRGWGRVLRHKRAWHAPQVELVRLWVHPAHESLAEALRTLYRIDVSPITDLTEEEAA